MCTSPRQAALRGEGLAESSLKDTTVTLPEGVAINPAGADGLEACSEAQIGFKDLNPLTETDEFTSGLPAPKGEPAEPFCPDGSKIGTVEIETPLLPNPLKGAVYLAAQNANPFGALVAMYIVAEDPISGVLVKLPGSVALDADTGRSPRRSRTRRRCRSKTCELHFFGGERAPLATPAHCGTYTTNASFAPWSGNAPVDTLLELRHHLGPERLHRVRSPLPFAPA